MRNAPSPRRQKKRETIEQAKGALMLAYGITPDQAFAMLQWRSRNWNLKLRSLAERLVEAISSGDVGHPSFKARVDALLHDISTGHR